MFKIEIEKTAVYAFEIEILSGYADDILLPLSIAEEMDKLILLYNTDNFIPLCAYGFKGELSCIFKCLRDYVRCTASCFDRLLRTDLLYNDGGMVFIRPEDSEIRLVYGNVDDTNGDIDKKSAEIEGKRSITTGLYGHIAKAIMPLLWEFSGLASIVGAKSAMTELAGKIRQRNPGSNEALMLIEQTERKWNIMQPVGI